MHPLCCSDSGRHILKQQPWETLSAQRSWISELLLSSVLAGAEGIVRQGQFRDRFRISLLWGSECQWRCVHHLCRHWFSPAIPFRGTVRTTSLEKHICLTAPSNFHSSLFSGASAVWQPAFSWVLLWACNECDRDCDIEMLYRLSKK